jgi:hypothetical protein
MIRRIIAYLRRPRVDLLAERDAVSARYAAARFRGDTRGQHKHASDARLLTNSILARGKKP